MYEGIDVFHFDPRHPFLKWNENFTWWASYFPFFRFTLISIYDRENYAGCKFNLNLLNYLLDSVVSSNFWQRRIWADLE